MIVECQECSSRFDLTRYEKGAMVHCRCGSRIPIPDLPETAKSMSCPQCGASADPCQTRCEFCAAYLAVLPCPRCFELLFIGAKHCSSCGAQASSPAYSAEDAAASTRRCPRCGNENKVVSLTGRILRDTLLEQCMDCGGTWLDMSTFDRVLAEQDRQTALRALGLPLERDAASQPMSFPVAYLKCPECGSRMHRRNFARRSGIIIDACKEHGIWFDRGELPSVLEFVSKGGLEASQKKDLEALKEEVARQKREGSEIPWQHPVAGGVHDSRYPRGPDLIEVMINAIHRLLRGF